MDAPSELDQLLSLPRVRSVLTPVQPSKANHSFNGVMFDIQAKVPEDVLILGFRFAGTGPITIYSSQLAWRMGVQPSFWEEVAQMTIKGPLRQEHTLLLKKPVLIEQGKKKGFYIHSTVLHDQGLKYQSYRSEQPITEDSSIILFPGQARCGGVAFEADKNQEDGWSWWRGARGFSGTIIYKAIKRVWSPFGHSDFPPCFQAVVKLLLLMRNRPDCILHVLPTEAIFKIVEQMDWDWFGVDYVKTQSPEPDDGSEEMEYEWDY